MDKDVELAHAKHDLHIYRGEVTRRVLSDIDLLRNALVALERGKTHVTKDHLERVIDSLKELAQRPVL